MQNNKDDSFVDRRRFPRYAVRYLTKVHLNGSMLCGTIVDISEGGVGVLLPEKLDEGVLLDIEISRVLVEEEVVETKFRARIVWISEMEIEKMYRAGLEITEIAEDDLERLRENIIELSMHKS